MSSGGVKCPRCGSEDTSLSVSIKLSSGSGDAGLSVDRITCKACGFDLPLTGLDSTATQALLGSLGTAQGTTPPKSGTPDAPLLRRDWEPIAVPGPAPPGAPGEPATPAQGDEPPTLGGSLSTAEAESDLLIEFASPELYRRNAFRVTGLSVDASTRDLDKKSEKLRMQEKFGGGPLRSTAPLPLDPPPGAAELREAVQRLHDPEGRLVDELFWFWPEDLGATRADVALSALGRGDVSGAERAWKEREREGTVASISTHNLAVLAHAGALDLELAGADGGTRVADRDRLWRDALTRWLVVLKEEAFWGRVEGRVRELDDPRLTRGTVLRMRGTLPKALLAINAQLALRAAEAGDEAAARRHVQYMRASGFDAGMVSDALRRVLEPLLSRLRMLAKRAEEEGDADPEKADAYARRLLEQAPPLLAIVDCLLEPGNPARATIHDEVAVHLLGCQITHGNKTGDWGTSIQVLEPALGIVEGEAARARIEQNLTIVRGNEELRAVWGTCWFCKEERPADSAAINVNMYGEVERIPTFQGTRITWRKGTIGVPRCLRCEESHLANFLWYVWFPLAFFLPIVFMPASWIRFVPRFKKYPTPAMGGLLGFSLGMLIINLGGWVWSLSTASRAASAHDEAMSAKWAEQSGFASVPGGSEVNPSQGLTQTAVDLINSLRVSPSQDEVWGDLGDAYSSSGNRTAAAGCWAVALLLDPSDSEWQGHAPDFELADEIVLGTGILDPWFAGQLGDAAGAAGENEARQSLYQLAAALEPSNPSWLSMANGPPPEGLIAAVAATRARVGVPGMGVPGGVLGGVPGGVSTPPGIPSSGSSLAASVRSNPGDDEVWGDLGDEYSARGNSRSAEGCWAVALLLDPTDPEWQEHSPNVGLADDVLLEVGVLDAWFANELANDASNQGYYDASDALNRLAAAIEPKNPNWEWAEPTRSQIAAVAEARGRFGIAAGPGPSQDTTSLLVSVTSNAYDDELWGDLGDAFAALGDPASAEACWAIALLRDPYDSEWLDHRPDLNLIPDFVLARGILLDDQMVGEMARTADSEGYSSASRTLFDLAWALDPSDPEWQDMNKGREIPARFATAIAQARAAQERRTRELAVENYLVSLRSDLTGGWNWGSAGNEYRNGGDTANARLFLGMAQLLDPYGSWNTNGGGSPEVAPAQAAEAVRALGVTDDEAVGRLANTLRASGAEEVAQGLYALALELDPDDPEWRMQIQGRPDAGAALAGGLIYAISLLTGALLGWYGAVMGRERRRKQGLRDKPKPTKGEGWKMEFPPVKEKLAAGWSLGDQPADATST